MVGVRDERGWALLWVTGIWLILFVAVAVGSKAWAMNGQPWHLWQEGHTPLSALLILDAHALRYMVYWPIFLIAEIFRIHPDYVFTIVSTLSSLILIWLIVYCEFLVYMRPPRGWIIVISAVIVIISFWTDGRITLLLMGYAMVVWSALKLVAFDRWSVGQAFALLGGGLICSLSSGTLAVVGMFVGLLGMWVTWNYRTLISARSFFFWVTVFFILYGGWILIGVFLNLSFYNFDPIAMLNHGVGGIALLLGPIGIVALSIAALASVWVVLWLYRNQSSAMFVLSIAIVSAAAGGVFGITAMSIGLVPLLLIIRPNLWF